MTTMARYIGLREKRNGPEVTRAVAWWVGRVGVPLFRKSHHAHISTPKPIAIAMTPQIPAGELTAGRLREHKVQTHAEGEEQARNQWRFEVHQPHGAMPPNYASNVSAQKLYLASGPLTSHLLNPSKSWTDKDAPSIRMAPVAETRESSHEGH